MGHHAGCGHGTEDVSRVLVSVQALLAKSSNANLQKVYDAVCKRRSWSMWTNSCRQSTATFHLIRRGLRRWRGSLVSIHAPRREPVKFGIAMLGIAGNEADVDVLRRIGECDEFTLFAAVAIQNVSGLRRGTLGISQDR
jgi:hypothetical protein